MCLIVRSNLTSPKCLSISCWNVNGLSQNSIFGDKLSNSDFLNSFNHHDLIILTETCSKDPFSIPGFKLISLSAKKCRTEKHGRFSGGVAFGFKTALVQGISHISLHTDYIWCKLDKNVFNTDKHIFICAIYSPYFHPDTFHDLENDIAKLSEDGYIILAGDFNARRASTLDYIDSDNCPYVPGNNLLPRQNLKRRKNFDHHINEHGNSFLDICKTSDFRILNGRSKGDSFGKITCHSSLGISTVHYFIVSHNMLNLVENFIVKQPTIFSDHSQLICWINNPLSVPVNTDTEPRIETFTLPRQFMWDNNSRQNFLDALNLDEFQSHLLLFEETYFDSTCEGINLATKQFTDLLHEISLRSLKLTCPKKGCKKTTL